MKLAVSRVIGLAVVIVAVGVVPVFAKSSDTMTDKHIARIKADCHLALAALSQIHANDAPVYINRNQTYYSISDKLMAPLNGRLALNRYDTTQLVQRANAFNDDLMKFRNAYKNYDDLMNDAIHIDCSKEPVGFYDKVADARDARSDVHDAAATLTDDINQYDKEVKAFQSQHFSSSTGDKR